MDDEKEKTREKKLWFELLEVGQKTAGLSINTVIF